MQAICGILRNKNAIHIDQKLKVRVWLGVGEEDISIIFLTRLERRLAKSERRKEEELIKWEICWVRQDCEFL